MWLTVVWLCAACAALYLYFKNQYSYFSRRGIKTPPFMPLFGHMGKLAFKQEHFADQIKKFYFDYPEERFVGRYEFVRPMLIIRDIELIKKVAVKDFEHFLDHRALSEEAADPLFGRNLFSMKGQEWRDMRSTLSPAFTSSKIRVMVPFMLEVCDQMIKALKQKIQASKTGYIDVDVKDLTSRYANDVIASCAFGVKVDSHSEVDNQFYAMGKNATTFEFKQLLLFFGLRNFPTLMRVLGLKFITQESGEFFRELVIDAMRNREAHNIIRPDMVHLLMEAKKGRLIHEEKAKDLDAGFATVEESHVGKKVVDRAWSDNDLIAQAVLFFVAGFDTVSSGMSFLLYELAVNPEVQKRLVREIQEHDKLREGRFDYSSIQKLPYMDMVISEVLRKWPPAPLLDRECYKEYNFGKPNSKATKDFIIPKGMSVGFPVWGFHLDPQYYPDPQKFDPERFSEENKHKINPFAYMPFGLGPRNCIGSRFALTEIKVLAYQLLQHMEISPGDKTLIPPVLDPSTITIRAKGGDWLRFRERTQVSS